MVRKVIEISLTWQRKTFKTTSRLRSAEQGVEDVLKRGVGTRNSAPGSSLGRWREYLGGWGDLPAPCCPEYLSPASRSVAVLAAMLLLLPVGVHRGCNNTGSREGWDFQIIPVVGFISQTIAVYKISKAKLFSVRSSFIIRINRQK